MTGRDPNPLDAYTQRLLAVFFRADYPQPRCPVWGRFAARTPGGMWQLACLVFDHGSGRWAHVV